MPSDDLPGPDAPRDDPDLEAALRDPAFDEVPAEARTPGADAPVAPEAVPPSPADDPGRPEDYAGEPGAPHLSLEEPTGDGDR